MRNFLFLVGLGVLLSFVTGDRSRKNIADIGLNFCLKGTPFEGMSDEEFTQEMMKGVQGNYTLEQVDSMYKEWAKEDSIYYSRQAF